MVICVKCGKEQVRRSGSLCEFNGTWAGKEHAWEDRGDVIAELRYNLPSRISERISELKKKYVEDGNHVKEQLKEINSRLSELLAAKNKYLDEELSNEIKKEKRRVIRPRLLTLIGCAIGVFIALWIFPNLINDLFEIANYGIFIVLATMLIVLGFVLRVPLLTFFNELRYAKSQNFIDDLASKWLDNHGYFDLKSLSEETRDDWENKSGSFERVIHDAERALVGSDEELLKFYLKDRQTKTWYLEKVYKGDSK